MSQDYGKFWEASLVYDLFISIQIVQIFSFMLQEGEVNLEKNGHYAKIRYGREKVIPH